MTPISFEQARQDYPDLVMSVISKLASQVLHLDPSAISWSSVQCHEDPDQPLDETVIADIMLTGQMTCRIGLCGTINGYYGCACRQGTLRQGTLRHAAS